MNLSEITKTMKELENWSLEDNTIVKISEFKDFKEALDFVNKVGEIAEKHGHHPDIIINYNKVRLILTTHSSGGLTEKDFEVAKEIDSLPD
ncbi:MAG: 4a-hydroxytetrahydrobiopterin dehydratase [Nanoarchaeota archaeon]|nr:4a-hydroxytetrahydrobiopterin dehydratase [Nanoarchaeota archaeon]